jgi:hypothetical protein
LWPLRNDVRVLAHRCLPVPLSLYLSRRLI